MFNFLPGYESEKRIDLLSQLIKVKSDQIIEAVKYHLSDGLSQVDAAGISKVDTGNLTRALKSFKVVAAAVEEIKEAKYSDNEAERRIDLILGLTNIKNNDLICSVKIHLLTGVNFSQAGKGNNVKSSKVSMAVNSFLKCDSVVSKIIEIDYKHIKTS